MSDFEISEKSKEDWIKIHEMVDTVASEISDYFEHECGEEKLNASSLAADLLLLAAWRVAGEAAIDEGRLPQPARFLKASERVTETFEWIFEGNQYMFVDGKPELLENVGTENE